MLIDSHAHLTDSKFQNVDEVIDRAVLAGVLKIIMPVGNLEDGKKALNLAYEHVGLYVGIGIHPEDLDRYDRFESVRPRIKKMILSSRKVVTIGEIGLDFYWDKEKKTKEKQIEFFVGQMELALELNLPVVIHMREAEIEMREIFEKFEKLPKMQMHCFAGSEDFLNFVIKRGSYVSFAGNVTFKSAENLRELLKKVPEDKLLIETDSPFLSPEPLRGTVNEPKNVKIIAEFVAGLLNKTLEQVAQTTTQNTICLFSLDT